MGRCFLSSKTLKDKLIYCKNLVVFYNTPNMLIIGLSGKMGSGKDFIGKHFIYAYLKKHYPHLNIHFLAFADALKIQAIDKYHLAWEDVYPPEQIPKTESVRKLLQFEGNLMREHNPYYWIKLYGHWAKLYKRNACDILITTDVRFPEERNTIIHDYNGIVCQVYAPSRSYQTQDSKLMQDKSECALDSVSPKDYYDYIFSNDEPFVGLEEAETRFQSFIELLQKKINVSV